MGSFYQLNDWNLFENKRRPYIIAGPCSVESRTQFLETASALKDAGVTVIRGGIWKPRTHPDSFEGVGEKGLEWMRDTAESLKLKTATEVANARHVEMALQYGIDTLWIGARTSGNPFMVQEISESLKGTDIPVLVKNPLVPDPELWAGSIERLYAAGLRKIGAVHRGFHTFERGIYRNAPLWQIPAELRRRFPDLPFFCDPSHISGDRKLVEGLCRQAMVLGFDGLMIEAHANPDKALSDAAQQVTPEALSGILDKIKIRETGCSASGDRSRAEDTIMELRKSIDRIDSSIIELLAERMKTAETIGELKESENITVLQPARWNDVLNQVLRLADDYGLDRHFVKKLFEVIHEASMERQIRK